MEPLRTELSHLLRQVNRQMHERFRHAFRNAKLQPHVFFMLKQVTQEPGVTVSELARRLSLVKSHVSKTIDLLDRQGYVEKRADESDQRLVRLYATPAAAELMAESEQIARQAWAEMVVGVPPEQLDTVVTGLRILLAAMEQPTKHGARHAES